MGKTKDQLTPGQMTSTNLAGGLIAGMAAAVISQPADTLLSKINKTKGAPGQSTTSRLVQMAGQLGAKGLFTGMSARLVMIGTLTAGQCESFFSPACWTCAVFWYIRRCGPAFFRRFPLMGTKMTCVDREKGGDDRRDEADT